MATTYWGYSFCCGTQVRSWTQDHFLLTLSNLKIESKILGLDLVSTYSIYTVMYCIVLMICGYTLKRNGLVHIWHPSKVPYRKHFKGFTEEHLRVYI